MKVAVTGARGFVGRWLARELQSRGHQVVPGERPEFDVTDPDVTRRFLERTRPEAVAHLAAVSFAPDARDDPAGAFATNVGGTINLLEAVRSLQPAPVVLVTGSSEVYGSPEPADLPLRESAPLRPRTPYGLSKAAQESVAIAYAQRYGLRLVVTRSFNHSGPGQRPVFVVPAVAARVRALRDGAETRIPVGNIDVRRDFTDVRDVVAAYRLLLEATAEGRIAPGGVTLNVASGRSVPIREVIEELCRLAGVAPRTETDPSLVRPDDPPDIVGDAGELRRLTGWARRHDLGEMLAAVWEDVAGAPAHRARAGADGTAHEADATGHDAEATAHGPEPTSNEAEPTAHGADGTRRSAEAAR